MAPTLDEKPRETDSTPTSIVPAQWDKVQDDGTRKQDPNEPLEWPKTRKWGQVLLVSALAMLANIGTSMCAPAAPNIVADLNAPNQTYLTLLISIWELGEAVGPLLIGPLSEIYGRRPLYHVTNVLFVIFSVACAVSPDVGSLVAFRFFNGMGVAAITLNPSVVGDLYPPEDRGGMMAFMMAPTVLGMLLAPILGGVVNQSLGWRWIFGVTAIAGAVLELGFIVCFRETYAPAIQRRAARRVGRTSDDKTPSARMDGSAWQALRQGLLRPAVLLTHEPIVGMLSTYVAVVYGEIYLITTTIAPLFEEYYEISEGNVGLTYLGRGIGMAAALIFCRFVLDRHIRAQKQTPQGMQPEHRLPPLLLASVTGPLGFLLYGWSMQYRVNVVVPILGSGIISASLILTTLPAFGYFVDAFPRQAASAIAASLMLRCIAGSLLPMAGPALYGRLGTGWGNTLMGLVTLLFTPLPVALLRYGNRLRNRGQLSATETTVGA